MLNTFTLLFIKFGKHQTSLLWEFTTLQEQLAIQVWVSLGSRPLVCESLPCSIHVFQISEMFARGNPEMKYKLPGIMKVHLYYDNLLTTFKLLWSKTGTCNPGIYFSFPPFTCLLCYPSALISLTEFDTNKQYKFERNCTITTSHKNSRSHGCDFEEHCLLRCEAVYSGRQLPTFQKNLVRAY